MDILKIAGVAIISVAAVTLLRESRPTLALILAISAGLVIVLMILDSLFEVIATFHGLADEFSPTVGFSGLFSKSSAWDT